MENKRLKPIAQIMLLPIIDILVFLIIFFIVAFSKVLPQFYAQKIDVPKSSSAEKIKNDKDYLEILVDREGNLYIKDRKISLNELENLLTMSKEKGVKNIIIRGDQFAPYHQIIKVIDSVKQVGLQKVLLLTNKSKG